LPTIQQPLKLKKKFDKSVTCFYCHVAARVPDIFCSFYFVKKHKIANISTTTAAKQKIITDLESLEFFDEISLNLKPIKFYLAKSATDF
jgi:hypothetical protein